LIYRRTFVVVFFGFIAGCSQRGPQIAPVHGRITLDGQPLPKAEITFHPAGSERPSAGRTDSDGRYELMFKRGEPGAMVGQNTVTILVSPEGTKNPPKIAPLKDPHREVKRGDNEINFEVTAEKK